MGDGSVYVSHFYDGQWARFNRRHLESAIQRMDQRGHFAAIIIFAPATRWIFAPALTMAHRRWSI